MWRYLYFYHKTEGDGLSCPCEVVPQFLWALWFSHKASVLCLISVFNLIPLVNQWTTVTCIHLCRQFLNPFGLTCKCLPSGSQLPPLAHILWNILLIHFSFVCTIIFRRECILWRVLLIPHQLMDLNVTRPLLLWLWFNCGLMVLYSGCFSGPCMSVWRAGLSPRMIGRREGGKAIQRLL